MGRRQRIPIEKHKLTKKWFMSLLDGYYVLINTYPFVYVELTENREQQWSVLSPKNAGQLVYTFSCEEDCLRSMDELALIREEAGSKAGRLVDFGKIADAYLQADHSLPRDPPEAAAFHEGTFRRKLTKKLLFSLPTGSRLISHTCRGDSMMPELVDAVPPLPEREGFWLQIKNIGLNGSTFDIRVERPTTWMYEGDDRSEPC